MKILFNFADYTHNPRRKKENTYGGIGYYRIVKIAEYLKGHDIKVIGGEILLFGDTLEKQWENVFKEYDVYWTNYFSSAEVGACIFYYAQKYGKKVVIDCDDNYLDIPESNLIYDKFKKTKKDRAILSTILSFADTVVVTTAPLQQRLKQHIKDTHGIDKNVVIIPNYNDIKDWNYKPAEKSKKDIIIGYAGSNSHHDDLGLVMPSIVNIMKKYKNVRFQCMGVVGTNDVNRVYKGIPKDIMDRMDLVGATETFKEYPEWLSKQKWDIGIAPLVNTAFTRSKSGIKWFEYSMYKIPTIASRVYPYFMETDGKDMIRHEETGLLAKDNEWEKHLEDLILNKDKRIKLGENAYNYIKENWQYSSDNITKKAELVLNGITESSVK
jgi:glycosyltransferase involved in cell wall biosynthesis